jgi:carboxyl-terminal processing protease
MMGKLFWRNKKGVFFIFGLGTIVGLIIGCQFLSALTPSGRIPADATGDFQLIAEAWNTIQKSYVDRRAVKPRQMTYGAIGGMIGSLGDTGHSRFLTPEMVKQERNFSKGQLEGIGAEVRMKNNQLVIVAPLDGSPAAKAALRPGDIILKVNGEEVSGLPLEQAVTRILGPPGIPVKLTILNPGTGQSRDLELVRARIMLRSVTWHLLPGTPVAHVRIADFSKNVNHDLQEVLRNIREKGASSLILDLRNNPGGLLEEAVGVTSQFVAGGNVLLEKDASGKVTPVPVKGGGLATDIPMIVLVNGGTASAPEIVAGALQDFGRAKILGEKTFGTGTVLERFSLSDGSAVLLAVQEWLTPQGRDIWHRGIVPDVIVPLPAEATPLFPGAEKRLTPAELWDTKDIQLLRGLEMISPAGALQGDSSNTDLHAELDHPVGG